MATLLAILVALPLGVFAALREGTGRLRHPGAVAGRRGAAGLLDRAAAHPDSLRCGCGSSPPAASSRNHLGVAAAQPGAARARAGLPMIAVLVAVVRGSMLDELDKPHIMTARAKGLRERTVICAATPCAAR